MVKRPLSFKCPNDSGASPQSCICSQAGIETGSPWYLSWIWVLFPHFSIFQSPIVRLSASKLMPTLMTGRPLRANLEA